MTNQELQKQVEELKSRLLSLEEELRKRKIQQISYPIDDISTEIINEKVNRVKATTAPATTASLLPSDRFGSFAAFMGGPGSWVEITLQDGSTGKIPLY